MMEKMGLEAEDLRGLGREMAIGLTVMHWEA